MNKELEDKADSVPLVKCFYCSDEFEEDNMLKSSINGNLYCPDCHNDTFVECTDCNEMVYRDGARGYMYGYLCDSCYNNNYFTCNQCDSIIHNDNYCENCDNDEGYSERKYYDGDKFSSTKDRSYSCEIECYYPSNKILKEAISEIPKEIGICEDGSLDDNGIEFNTPKLSGAKGKNLLQSFCETLNDKKFKVNNTCGLHIHLDGKDILETKGSIQKMMIFFMIYEDVIMSFLPASRRENTYCLPLSEFYHLNEIKNCFNTEELEKVWYRQESKEYRDERKKDRHDRTRYAGINFHSLLAQGHLEIRYHSGTINYEKISNWIKLFILIMDKINNSCEGNRFYSYDHPLKISKLNTPSLLKAKFILGLPEKTSSFFDMIDAPKELRSYFLDRQKKFIGNSEEETN